MKDSEAFHNPLKGAIIAVLENFPFGLSEYDLIRELKRSTNLIPDDFAKNSLILFQTHFLVFNALYQLQRDLAESGDKYLEINPLCIRLLYAAVRCDANAVTENSDEKLRAYYLDMSHLWNTGKEDVACMLDRFWKFYNAAEDRLKALETLNLAEPVNYDKIKGRYRDLAKKNHPDRGGDKSRLQEINRAMGILKIYYGSR